MTTYFTIRIWWFCLRHCTILKSVSTVPTSTPFAFSKLVSESLSVSFVLFPFPRKHFPIYRVSLVLFFDVVPECSLTPIICLSVLDLGDLEEKV